MDPGLERVTRRAVDRVLVLDAPPEILAKRIRHRLTCTECFATFGPGYPAFNECCRFCGASLERRQEDIDAQAIARRDDVWRAQGALIVAYYRSRARVDVLESTGPVAEMVRRAAQLLGLPGEKSFK